MATKPTKTTPATTKTESPVANNASKNNNNQQSDKQSQFATILVGLLIIASGLLIYNYFQRTSAPEITNQNEQQQEQANNQNENESNGETAGETDENSDDSKEGEYTVMPGDSLWSIAEKAYGDGHQWRKIADANEIQNNAYGQPTVEIGQVLNVPDSAAVAEKPQDEEPVATDKQVAGVQEVNETPSTAIETYTVQTGDSLWSIAEQVYGDGHRWVDIYNDPHNELGSLNGRPIVHAGNVLYLPSIE